MVSFELNHVIFLCTGFTARILRAIRIAARLSFHFTKDLALSVKELSWSIRKLDKVLQNRVLFPMILLSSWFIMSLFTYSIGKDPHGNELHAGLWIFRGFYEVIMEVWTARDASACPGTQLFLSLFIFYFFFIVFV